MNPHLRFLAGVQALQSPDAPVSVREMLLVDALEEIAKLRQTRTVRERKADRDAREIARAALDRWERSLRLVGGEA